MIIDNIEYEVDKGKRKNIYITIKDGKVIIKTPKHISNKQIQDIVYSKREWITKNLEKYNKSKPLPKKYIDGENFRLLGKDYILKICYEKVEKCKVTINENFMIIKMPLEYIENDSKELQIKKEIDNFYLKLTQNMLVQTMEKITNKVGLYPNKYRIRNMKTAWGSCSSNRNISIAFKLIEHSPEAFEYVVLHEVYHLKYMNHSKKFWDLVAMHMKDYKIYRKELKK